MSRTVLDGAMSMARRYEGTKLKAYLCPAGVWTIGVGATGKGIGPGLVWTLEEAIERLERDCVRSVGMAYKHCPILYGEPDSRVIAVGDFVFNLGRAPRGFDDAAPDQRGQLDRSSRRGQAVGVGWWKETARAD